MIRGTREQYKALRRHYGKEFPAMMEMCFTDPYGSQ